MSKELIKRLRSDFPTTQAQWEAAYRIEELERERDALQADNARLREVLVKHVAPYLGHKEVYDEVLASIPAQLLARLRNRVLNKAINVAWNHEPYCNGPIEMALRKLKEPE